MKKKKHEHKGRICPKCKRSYFGFPAISRRDNKSEICPDCGLHEAIADWFAWEIQQKYGKNKEKRSGAD